MAMERVIGQVRELWRHPVKSFGGERIGSAAIELRFGVRGDRAWAIRDVAAGEIRGGKKIPALMQLGARYLVEPAPAGGPSTVVEIDLGDGSWVRSDEPAVSARLSERLGRGVELCARPPAEDKDHYLRARPITDPEEGSAIGNPSSTAGSQIRGRPPRRRGRRTGLASARRPRRAPAG